MLTADATASARSAWMRDPDALDPSTWLTIVTRGGRSFKVKNTLGPGWPMTLRVNGEDRTFWNRTVEWEDWNAVDREIDQFLSR